MIEHYQNILSITQFSIDCMPANCQIYGQPFCTLRTPDIRDCKADSLAFGQLQQEKMYNINKVNTVFIIKKKTTFKNSDDKN